MLIACEAQMHEKHVKSNGTTPRKFSKLTPSEIESESILNDL